jgi:hypothetical protein
MRTLRRVLGFVVVVLAPLAGAQSWSVWGSAQGAYGPPNGLHARLSVGVGIDLPVVGTLGVEVTPYGYVFTGATTNVYGVAAVLRDVGLPFTPISLRGEVGLEKFTTAGPFDSTPWTFFVGGGVRYVVFGPLGLTAGARVYVNSPGTPFSVLVGLDLKL